MAPKVQDGRQNGGKFAFFFKLCLKDDFLCTDESVTQIFLHNQSHYNVYLGKFLLFG